MIYFTNADLHAPHMAFIGRWSPFHKGHTAILQKKMREHPRFPVLIMVRDTGHEVYPAPIRAEYIKLWMLENNISGTIMIIPNIEGVYWGRGVGYAHELVDIDEHTKRISATQIRGNIRTNSPAWLTDVASITASHLLSPKISSVMEHGRVIWLTGYPASGKTTIARATQKYLHTHFPYLRVQVLDGDDIRSSPIARGTGFTRKDRASHIRRMGYLAKMFADHGICVICAFISPEQKIRSEIKRVIGKNRFIEVYVQASKQTRMKRDPKQLYKKAVMGDIKNFTGVSAPYEIPKNPDVVCNTDAQTVDQSVHRILAALL